MKKRNPVKGDAAKQLHVFFLGRVQGVGFRYTVQSLSRRFAVSGFVRNLPDGRVELLAEGDAEDLEEFLNSVTGSHLSTFIRETRPSWNEARGNYDSFEIAV